MKLENREIRAIKNVEIRKSDDDRFIVDGYIAMFEVETELFDGFFEKIDRNAFDKTLASNENIWLLYHHDYSKPLASTRNNTLKIYKDTIGLRFEAELNSEISYAKDAYTLVKSGEMRGCSFGFIADDDEYIYDNVNDTMHRTLKEVTLFEGTLTPIPAYDSTLVKARCKAMKETEKREMEEQRELEQLEIECELFEIENATR